MAQLFTINRGSELPYLRMELINDGRHDYHKFYLAIQDEANSHVTFSMRDAETGVYKIANAEAHVVYDEDSGCEERYLLEYRWKKRDTNMAGRYIGTFKITFSGNIKMDGVNFPSGELIVPIQEDLVININDSTIIRN